MINIYREIFLELKDDNTFQFLKYSLVGGIASITDFSIYSIITVLLDHNYIFANMFAFFTGLLVNYFLCKIWVFSCSNRDSFDNFLPFAIIGFIGVLISNAILFLLIDFQAITKILFFLNEDYAKLIAKVITMFVVLFWNYIMRKKYVFGKSNS